MTPNSGNDEIEVTARADSLSLRAKGDAASRLGHQIADIISPFSGLLGAVGDQIAQYRILRREAAAAALLRARELKEANGEFPHPVSQKLLAPWLEGASCEDLDKENVLELWARILAKSPEELDAAFLRYIDIAKNIGPKEAQLFEKIMSHYLLTQIPEGFFRDTSLGNKSYNMAATENNNWLIEFSREIFDANGKLINRSEIVQKIDNLNIRLVGQIINFMALPRRDEKDRDDRTPHLEWIMWEHPCGAEIELLRLIGLLRNGGNRAPRRNNDADNPVIALELVEPTALGCSFYFSVIANKG